MISLWYENEVHIEYVYEAKNLIKQEDQIWVISPTLKFSMAPLIVWLQKNKIAYTVVLPIPNKWAQDYLKQSNPKRYNELLWLMEHAEYTNDVLPFSWVTPMSYFNNEYDYRYQRYMVAKKISGMDEGILMICGGTSFKSDGMASCQDIFRMRLREYADKNVWRFIVSKYRRIKKIRRGNKKSLSRKGVKGLGGGKI